MRLGVLGTMVWDRIHARDGLTNPLEEWGGAAYALAAAATAAPAGTTIVPLVRVGADLAERAFQHLRGLPGLDLETGVRVVPEPNNRVELRYQDSTRRVERLTGGVGPWSWTELAPMIAGLDALYVNFISGFELELPTAVAMRANFPGPIYADLHSLLLGVGPDGVRVPRPLDAWPEWLRCFDAVQVNEDEIGLLATAWRGDPFLFAADVVGDAPRLVVVTLGERGAVYFAASDMLPDPLSWQRPKLLAPGVTTERGAVHTRRIATGLVPRDGDPTGCGDVWGATFFCRLLDGAGLDTAMRHANEAASRNVEHRGAAGLHHHLQGRIGT
jgi:sugar/nucleoside kinase (ribokinase family)